MDVRDYLRIMGRVKDMIIRDHFLEGACKPLPLD